MLFLLTDGVIPESGLPTASFLKLEDWVRLQSEKNEISYSTTDLKNKTGELLQQVAHGKTIKLFKHGRLVAYLKPVVGV